jgi:hypothetical protein
MSQSADQLAAADKFNRLMLNLTARVADVSSGPAWKDSRFESITGYRF